MDDQYKTRYFLGSNSGDGFHSLYDGFVDCAGGDFLWVIKGGPGCGKSSFMKRIGHAAESAGLTVEYILCSSDPDSLDGIYIPALRVGYVDGTAPHVMEAPLPGAGALYLDLGSFYDSEPLVRRRDDIAEHFAGYQALYARAYDLLAAAARVSPERAPFVTDEDLLHAVRRRALGVAARELKRRGGQGTVKRRFLTSNTYRGQVYLWETVAATCGRVYVLDNELGLAHTFMETILACATERGVDAVLCPSPLCPETLEALLLPDLAFVAASAGHEYPGPAARHIRLDAMVDQDRFRALRADFRRCARLKNDLLRAASDALSGSKTLHDALESIYNPYVDFEGLYALADEHAAYLLGST